MKAFCFFSLLVSTVLLSSCSQFIPVSRFAKGQELLGISKELFLAQYGMPYSQDAYYTPDSVMEERLFYIERLCNGDWHLFLYPQELPQTGGVWLGKMGQHRDFE